MKITIESTSKLVYIQVDVTGPTVPARVWQGETESGIPVQCYITRVVPEIPPDDDRQREFLRELEEVAKPRPTVEAIPLRLIL